MQNYVCLVLQFAQERVTSQLKGLSDTFSGSYSMMFYYDVLMFALSLDT